MEISLKPGKGMCSKIGKIAAAIALALMICSVAAKPARADDHGKHDNDRGHQDNDRGRRGPNVYYAPEPDYYYAPQPNYYYAPEPDYYYPPESQPGYYPPQPSDGINLFFGR